MPNHTDRFTILDIARQVEGQMVPVNRTFSFFSTTPIVDEDLKQYVQEPLAALPPAATALLPRIELLLVPHLERSSPRSPALVAFEPPPTGRALLSAQLATETQVLIALATSDVDMSEYHYSLYDAIAGQLIEHAPASFMERFNTLLLDEVNGEANGEIRQESWELKQKYLQRSGNGKRELALWTDYRRQALRDTTTLFLHGICCDIDVEAGPRQLASRFIRKRLELLKEFFPPPEGYALFPEQVRRRKG